MTTLYTGSNYGILSTVNSGSGTLAAIGATTSFSYETIQHNTCGSILLTISGINPCVQLNIYHSKDAIGTNASIESYQYSTSQTVVQNIQQLIAGAYIKVELIAKTTNIVYSIQTRYNNSGVTQKDDGYVSVKNSFIQTTTVAPATIFAGLYEYITEYSLITLLVNGTPTVPGTNCGGLIEAYFSLDGIHDDRIVSYPVQDVAANGTASSTTSLTFNPAHTLLPISPFFKIRYVQGANALNDIRITVLYHREKSKALTSRVTQRLTDYFDTDTTRSIMNGRTLGTTLPGGHYENISCSNGLLNVSLKDPVTAFGEMLMAELTPQIQYDFSSGRPYDTVEIYQNTTATSSYTFTNGMLQANVSGANSVVEVNSKDYTKYKQGQGIDARFTGIFTTGYVAGANQFLGLYTPEDALSFGYFDAAVSGTTEFCIMYKSFGTQAIWHLDVSGTVSINGSITVTFGGTNVLIPVLAGDNAKQVAYKISTLITSQAYANLNTYGWITTYWDNGLGGYTVECIYQKATNINISVASPQIGITLVATQKRIGQDATIQYIPQSTWNYDTCIDQGSLEKNYIYNPSGFRLNTARGNVYRIQFQYLGFGAISFYVENPETGYLILVHQIKYANSGTRPSIRIPNYKAGLYLENVTNNTLVQLNICCVAVFTQGKMKPSPIYRSYGVVISNNTAASLPTTPQTASILMGIRGQQSFYSTNSDGITQVYSMNRNNIPFNFFSCSVNSGANQTSNIIFIVIKNPTTIQYISNPVSGTAAPWKNIGNNLTYVFDGLPVTATTGVTYTGGDIVIEIPLTENASQTFNLNQLDLNMTADDTFLIGFYGTSSNTFDVIGTLSWYVNM
jgi:hypothetical protein